MRTVRRLTESSNLNLVKRYPISALHEFKKTVWPLVVGLGAGMLVLLSSVSDYLGFGFLNLDPTVEIIFKYGAVIALSAWVLLFLYQTLVRLTIYYGIENGHFVISRGIILKKRGFFPLNRITDVYLERSLADLIFGLHTLHVSTPTALSEQFARVEGLSTRNALGLQKQLTVVLSQSEAPLETRHPHSGRGRYPFSVRPAPFAGWQYESGGRQQMM